MALSLKLRRPQPGLAVSAGVHALVLAAALFAASARDLKPAEEGIPVEVITENQLSQITRGQRDATKPSDQTKPRADRVAETMEQRDPGEAKSDAPAPPQRPPEMKLADAETPPPAPPLRPTEMPKEPPKETAEAADPPPPAPPIRPKAAEMKRVEDAKKEAEAKEAQAKAEQAKAEKARAEAQRREESRKVAEREEAEEEAREKAETARAEAKAKAEKARAEAKAKADAQAKAEQAKAEAAERAAEKAEAERRKVADAKAAADKAAADKARAEAAEKAAERAALAKAVADAKAKADAAAHRQAELANKFNAGDIRSLLASREPSRSSGATGREVQRVASLGTEVGTAQRLSPSQRDSLVGILQSQIERCYAAPPGAQGGIVLPMLDIRLNPDGSFAAQPQILRGGASQIDASIAQAALRAVRRCAPYRIPAQFAPFYQDWKVINAEFQLPVT